jgi:large subunit ribosomal protein L25
MKKMEKVVIPAEKRTVTGKKVGALRRQGKLPGVIYGPHIDSTPIVLDLHNTTVALRALTSSSLITINLEGVEIAALVREKQRDVITRILQHIDFQAVSMTEKLRTTVGIIFTGVAPALQDFNGIVISGVSNIEVECLPQYLPERIFVDLSSLKAIGDGIYVRDLKLESQVEILTPVDEMVVIITAPTVEVEEEVAVVETTLEEPEVIEKGKKEEEVPD